MFREGKLAYHYDSGVVTQLQAEPDAMEEPVDDVCGNHETGWYICRQSVRVSESVRLDVGRGDTALESLVGVYCKESTVLSNTHQQVY